MQKDAIRYLIEQYLYGQLTEAQGQELLELTNTRGRSGSISRLERADAGRIAPGYCAGC
jgi:hypothetical protein